MMLMFAIVFFSAGALGKDVEKGDWINTFDKPFTFQCKPGKMFGSISSYHSNLHEDRRWNIGCWRNVPIAPSWWSPYVNDYNGYFNFRCPFASVMTGMAGIHNNEFQDTRFKFHCTQRKWRSIPRCGWTGYWNKFEASFNFVVWRSSYLSGVRSYHSNKHQDRRFAFLVCTFT